MKPPSKERGTDHTPLAPAPARGRLFRKYVALFVAVVSIALAANGLLDMWFSYREQRALLINTQREQASAAAARITHFLEEIERQMGWITQLPWSASTIDDWRLDAARLQHQVPAITELTQIDATGRQLVRTSRVAADVVGSGTDQSQDPKFVEAMAHKRYFGPVYFLRESEPYMTLSIGGARREYGVVAAEVNLKFIWDVVSEIKVGNSGKAYVVDAKGRLIAHPDISLVLRNTDLSQLAQVRAARAAGSTPLDEHVATDIHGERVLTAHAPVASLGWLVFVDLPVAEAYAPFYASILRSGTLIAGALTLAVLAGILLARRMVVPIQALRDGAARIGGGDLNQRILINTGDELEALGHQFNSMAAQLQDSYATLERKVEERTRQLALANQARSRFLAAASHDLRQPLHALGLFVAQLRSPMPIEDRGPIVERITAAITAMNDLFNSLLDISKLDAGVMAPNITEFPVAHLFRRIETTFAETAGEKGLSLRICPTDAWVCSDMILLERILLNLVSNAVRYTSMGGVLVGCRRRGEQLSIQVWDTGPGIPEDQRQNIFGEFYRIGESGRNWSAGLGLGLAIVDRLCRLLNHPIDLRSKVGAGSRFSVQVPLAAARYEAAKPPSASTPLLDMTRGKLVVVIDDDPLVLEGMAGLFRNWGCRIVMAASESAAIEALDHEDHVPDLIVSDYRLRDGKSGIDVIRQLRSLYDAPIPAFLISGDITPEALRSARSIGLHLLHKPVEPMTLRAVVNRMLGRESIRVG